MLFKADVLRGIAMGSITVAFRRWRRPSVKAGGSLRSSVGVLGIDEVARIEEDDITEADAKLAGYDSRDHLVADLHRRRDGDLYRIKFHLAGTDPRITLRGDDRLTDQDVEDIKARLVRLDRSSRDGDWTLQTLRLISDKPATRAAELAAEQGQERIIFKRNVRKLKEMGLTESLERGYRLSPRGRAVLRRLN